VHGQIRRVFLTVYALGGWIFRQCPPQHPDLAPYPVSPGSRLEEVPDPKQALEEALRLASEKVGRHKRRFERDLSSRRRRVAELIGDYSPLRHLSAFQELEKATRRAFGQLRSAQPES
jgi:hypothetical protein